MQSTSTAELPLISRGRGEPLRNGRAGIVHKDIKFYRGFQLDGHYNLSELAVVFKITVRIDNLVEGKNFVDDWLKGAFL
jgi:hypothetical protein